MQQNLREPSSRKPALAFMGASQVKPELALLKGLPLFAAGRDADHTSHCPYYRTARY